MKTYKLNLEITATISDDKANILINDSINNLSYSTKDASLSPMGIVDLSKIESEELKEIIMLDSLCNVIFTGCGVIIKKYLEGTKSHKSEK